MINYFLSLLLLSCSSSVLANEFGSEASPAGGTSCTVDSDCPLIQCFVPPCPDAVCVDGTCQIESDPPNPECVRDENCFGGICNAGICESSEETTVSAGGGSLDNAPFADDLTLQLYTKGDNECTSSLGVSMAMSLIYPSAISDSALQMQSVLGYPKDQSILLWDSTTVALTTQYQGSCYDQAGDGTCYGSEPTLEIANRVFVDQTITLNSTYAAIVGNMVEQLDFASQDAGSLVNKWVNTSTNGLVDSIVEEGPLSPWIVLAINSIYLKASWEEPFSDLYTNKDVFYTITNDDEMATTSPAHFMHQVEYFWYSHDILPGYQILQLPFSGGSTTDMSMIFVLPLPETKATATSVDVLESLANLTYTRVAIALPKFEFESEYKDELKAALQSINLTAPFEMRSDNLCLVENRCDAFVDMIIQKTYINVNEDGVEAAAVTALGIELLSAGPPPVDPILFEANRPFQFFIYEKAQNVVLFEGQVGDPGIVEGSSLDNSNLGTAQHTDPEFWSANFYVNPIVVANVTTTTTTSNEDAANATVVTSKATPEEKDANDEGDGPTEEEGSNAARLQSAATVVRCGLTMMALGFLVIFAMFAEAL